MRGVWPIRRVPWHRRSSVLPSARSHYSMWGRSCRHRTFLGCFRPIEDPGCCLQGFSHVLDDRWAVGRQALKDRRNEGRLRRIRDQLRDEPFSNVSTGGHDEYYSQRICYSRFSKTEKLNGFINQDDTLKGKVVRLALNRGEAEARFEMLSAFNS